MGWAALRDHPQHRRWHRHRQRLFQRRVRAAVHLVRADRRERVQLPRRRHVRCERRPRERHPTGVRQPGGAGEQGRARAALRDHAEHRRLAHRQRVLLRHRRRQVPLLHACGSGLHVRARRLLRDPAVHQPVRDAPGCDHAAGDVLHASRVVRDVQPTDRDHAAEEFLRARPRVDESGRAAGHRQQSVPHHQRRDRRSARQGRCGQRPHFRVSQSDWPPKSG